MLSLIPRVFMVMSWESIEISVNDGIRKFVPTKLDL